MSKNYGCMVGCNDAVEWVRGIQTDDKDMQDRVIARMRYEFDKDIEVPAKYYPGKYGHKYDSCTCGNCGFTVDESVWHFCPNCGFRIGRHR